MATRVEVKAADVADLGLADAGRLKIEWADVRAVRSTLAHVRPDVVLHLAGHVTGAQDLALVEPTFQMNLTSTVHLLIAAAETRPRRLVLVGSMQEPDPDHPAPVPCSPYAASKWAASGYARMFHALYHLPVAVARPMMVYGPGQWDLLKVLPYVTVSLLGGTPPVLGSGARIYLTQLRDRGVCDGQGSVGDLGRERVGHGRLSVNWLSKRNYSIHQRDRAAWSVFLISMTTVIGPVPPGTGVIALATSRADSNSTSP